jgi:hypothetical protein
MDFGLIFIIWAALAYFILRWFQVNAYHDE